MGSLDELRKQAHDNASTVVEEADTWAPKEEGDELAGTITKIEFTHTRFGPAYVLKVRDEDGKPWTLWVSGTVLKKEMAKYAPGVDALVVVVFGGSRKGKSGYAYNHYTVLTSGDRCQDQWDTAREEYVAQQELADAMGTAKNQAGITAPGDDEMLNPF